MINYGVLNQNSYLPWKPDTLLSIVICSPPFSKIFKGKYGPRKTIGESNNFEKYPRSEGTN